MKRAKATILTLSLIFASVWFVDAFAQGKGHGHGHHKKEGRHNHHRKDYHDGHGRKVYHYDRGHSNHRLVRVVRPVNVHQHYHDCGHRVVVHHYDRPRYVYYSDYDVYYDYQRSMYISYSGHHWSVSASLPVCLHRVDLRRAHRVEVEYFDDDFVSYLDHGRPMFGAVYVSR